ncbi:MAG: YgiT-type zinc finger protein [Acetivibrionales bacterium]|jgi:YgiT-type zinc finger domain-containing protein|nr:YgiT-type zinc finger protein [Bacillota bacterium]NLP07636.1 YgiT-type zinc finger protein [Clostridiaceae bacterium]HOA54258.1 YgiT-type zinc finger protein [Clostridiales bacterium]HQD30605.1 YgiT-type zinc finger protein [Clostridiales bacterium]
MKAIRCLFCDRTTTVHHINAQKRIKGKIVTLTNAPVYYCAHCKETFLSKETQDVFRYIQDRSLDAKRILFNFEDMVKRLYQAMLF